MTEDVKIQVVTAPAEATPAPAVEPAAVPEVKTLTDQVAIISYIERELVKLPGCKSKRLYSLQEGDRGYNRNYLTFKLSTDYTVEDQAILKPWKDAFNLRLWQHDAAACKEKKQSLWPKDNLEVEVSETVSDKYWTFRLSNECLSVLREHIAVEKGASAVGVRRVSDFY